MTPALDTLDPKLARQRRMQTGAARPARQVLLLVLLAAAAWPASMAGAAESGAPLTALPVTETRVVPPADYRAAASRAARGATPIEIALAAAGPFEGRLQQVIQAHEGAESPTAARVTLLRDGLLDDAVRGERWEFALRRNASGRWQIDEVRRAWRCWRGAQTDAFGATRCP
jgi:hypothetical protein